MNIVVIILTRLQTKSESSDITQNLFNPVDKIMEIALIP